MWGVFLEKKSFYIKTYGCKVNQYESQVIRENFLEKEFREAETPDSADTLVVNTCTVTDKSDAKSLKTIRRFIKNKDKDVIVTGCLVEDQYFDISRLKGVRFIVKNESKYKIPEIVYGKNVQQDRDTIRLITGLKSHTRVFVKIQDGCDNKCSYCKVRLVRGGSKSRPVDEILCECDSLIKNGSKELVLTGICLGSYGRDISETRVKARYSTALGNLIEEICKLDGDWRLRLSSIEPKDINGPLLKQFQRQKKICPHLHIPFQSGDDEVLKKMNRSYTQKDYLDIVNKVKRAIPDIAISTDIMVGFPGEKNENFERTMDFIKIVRPMRIHIFPFSKRLGTPAYNYIDDVRYSLKKERAERLCALSKILFREFVELFIDKEVEVLIEDKTFNNNQLEGYTDRYIRLFVEGEDFLRGRLLKCRLTLTNGKVYGILPTDKEVKSQKSKPQIKTKKVFNFEL